MEEQPFDTKRLLLIMFVSLLLAGGMSAYQQFFGDKPAETDESATAAQNDGGDEKATPVEAPKEETAPSKKPLSPEARAKQEQLFHIETDSFSATFTNLNSALKDFTLKSERWTDTDGNKKNMVSTFKEQYLPLRVELSGVNMPDDAVWTGEQLSPTSVRFTWEGNGFRVGRRYEAGGGAYQLWSTLRIENISNKARAVRPRVFTYHYVAIEAESGGFMASRAPGLSHGICMYGEETIERLPRDDAFEPQWFGPEVGLAGVEDTYFANVIATENGPAARCTLHTIPFSSVAGESSDYTLFATTMMYPRSELKPGGETLVRNLAYLGPKDRSALEAAGHGIPKVIDFGWFAKIAEGLVWLLGAIQGYVGNWGLAIILMTMLVRILLFPLTVKSFKSMARMRLLKPEMDRVNELYKDDREKKGMAMMELYRKHQINPMSGCLPQLLQMPVWFAFYASLSTNTELYKAGFALWWTDLSAPDPYFVLPVIIGALMFLQQKLTPTTMDAMQAKMMMYFMPVMITSFMLFLPAGLCLYMATNSLLGIAQQTMVQRTLDRQTALAAESGENDNPTGTDAADGKPAGTPTQASQHRKKAQRAGKRRTRRA